LFQPGSILRIEGEAFFEGYANHPVILEGAPNGSLIEFAPPLTTATLRMLNVNMRKAGRGIAARGGILALDQVHFDNLDEAVRLDGVSRAHLSRCRFIRVRKGLEGRADHLEVAYSLFDNPQRAINIHAPSLVLTANDFYGKGLAIAQMAPVPTAVDGNFFDSTDPLVLAGRIQGPCVFQRIYRNPSSERLLTAPNPEPYNRYLERAGRLYANENWEAAMREYLRAWCLNRERRVGLRLVELLRRESLVFIPVRREQRTATALGVARSLTLMDPDDPDAWNLYVDSLRAAGYE
jgi:hypothetical protein